MMLRSGKSSLSKEHIRIGRREADMEEGSPRRSMREGRRARTMIMSSPVSPVRSRSPATRGRSRSRDGSPAVVARRTPRPAGGRGSLRRSYSNFRRAMDAIVAISPQRASSSELAVPGVDEEASVEIVEDRIVEDRIVEDRIAEDTMVEDRVLEDRIVDTSEETGCVEIVEARAGKVVEAREVTRPIEIVEDNVVEAGLVEAGVVEASGAGQPPPACSEEVAELRRNNTALEAQVARQEVVLASVYSSLQCPVCLEVPHSLPVLVCANGHTCCNTCSTTACPVCRDTSAKISSLLAGRLVQVLPHKCSFPDCGQVFPVAEIEQHVRSCSHRFISCVASSQCRLPVTPASLQDHLLSGKCRYTKVVRKESSGRRLDINFSIEAASLETRAKRQYTVRVFTWRDRCFVINLRKLQDTFLVLVLMLGSSEDCSKFRVSVSLGGEGARVSFESAPVPGHTDKARWSEEGNSLSVSSMRRYLSAPLPGDTSLRLGCSVQVSVV